MPHKLQNMLAKVPSDIDIAQAAKPIAAAVSTIRLFNLLSPLQRAMLF